MILFHSLSEQQLSIVVVDCAVSFLSFTLFPHDLSQLAFFIIIIIIITEHHNIWHQIHLSLKLSLTSSLFSVKHQ